MQPEYIKSCDCGGHSFKYDGIQWYPERYKSVIKGWTVERTGEVGYRLFTCLKCGTTKVDKPC